MKAAETSLIEARQITQDRNDVQMHTKVKCDLADLYRMSNRTAKLPAFVEEALAAYMAMGAEPRAEEVRTRLAKI